MRALGWGKGMESHDQVMSLFAGHGARRTRRTRGHEVRRRVVGIEHKDDTVRRKLVNLKIVNRSI